MADDRKIDVHVPDALRGGAYANNLVVGHTREEFVLDWIMLGNDGAVLTARVVTSPGHMKRVLGAMQANVELYERKFGEIEEAEPGSPTGSQPTTVH